MLPTSQPPAMESIEPGDWPLINPHVLISKDMNLKLEGRFKDAAVVVDFVLVNYFRNAFNIYFLSLFYLVLYSLYIILSFRPSYI